MFHICLLIGIHSATQLPSAFPTSLCAIAFPICLFALDHGNTVFLDTSSNKMKEKLLAKMQFSVKNRFQEHFKLDVTDLKK